MVTSISECPLNKGNDILFATGCYDGNLAVWDLEERTPVFTTECSNVLVILFRGKFGVSVGIQEPSSFLSTEMS